MISWNVLLLAGCATGLFLLYQEWTRKRPAHRWPRLVAIVIIIVSMAAMAYPYTQKTQGETSIVLLTNGFSKDSVEQFLKKNKSATVLSAANQEANTIYGQAVLPIASWKTFVAANPHPTIDVFGTGLNKAALQALAQRPIIFHPAPAAPAATNVYWEQHLPAGEPLIVQGHYINPSRKKIKLALQVFGSVKDTLFIEAGQEKDFQLEDIPLHSGNAIYSLLAIAENDTIQRSPVPVSVINHEPIKLLIISAAPDFENTYLKNHLSKQGYMVAATTIVSTHKTNQQFLNMAVQKDKLLTRAYLSQFDVLLSDGETLEKLDRVERQAIASAVQNAGTGLLVKLDTAGSRNDFYSKLFAVKKMQPKSNALVLHEAASDSNRVQDKGGGCRIH